MYALELRVVDTDHARDIQTHFNLNARIDDPQYDPKRHEPIPFSYREALRNILGQPIDPRAGANYDDMASAIAVIRKLKKATDGDTIYLDPDDFGYVKRKLEAMQWPILEEWIFEFRADILGSAKVDDSEIARAIGEQKDSAPNKANGKKALNLVRDAMKV